MTSSRAATPRWAQRPAGGAPAQRVDENADAQPRVKRQQRPLAPQVLAHEERPRRAGRPIALAAGGAHLGDRVPDRRTRPHPELLLAAHLPAQVDVLQERRTPPFVETV